MRYWVGITDPEWYREETLACGFTAEKENRACALV